MKPFDDKDVRWALSHYIDREQLIDVGYLGASQTSALPMPPYKPLLPYFDAVKDLLVKYNTLEFNPKKGDALLQRQGLQKEGGTWVWRRTGKPLKVDIIGFGAVRPGHGAGADGDAEAARRRRQRSALPPDFDDRFQKGEFVGSIYGHGGSISEPYDTLRLYQSQSIAVPGAHLVNFSPLEERRIRQDRRRGVTSPIPNDKAAEGRCSGARWRSGCPSCRTSNWCRTYHRIPMNTTYWKNWPTADNPYINGASWHLTYPIVLWNLKQA